MSWESAIYEGSLRHRRRLPKSHEFTYTLFMMYLDLEELPRLFDGRLLWSERRPALARFRRSDYLGEPTVPLDQAVRQRIQEKTGRWPEGPIRLLTHLRYFGHHFSPVSFYYCFAPDGREIEQIVAEVTNTPWKERHAYVLSEPSPEAPAGVLEYHPSKLLHVSPFMQMEDEYDWKFTVPGPRLLVHMENRSAEGKVFDATLELRRLEISGRQLARVLGLYPWMTLKMVIWIHYQALRLWLKGVPFIPHPKKREDR